MKNGCRLSLVPGSLYELSCVVHFALDESYISYERGLGLVKGLSNAENGCMCAQTFCPIFGVPLVSHTSIAD